MKIAILGCAGRMGRMLLQAVDDNASAEISGAAERAGSEWIGQDVSALIGGAARGIAVTDDLDALFSGADAVIESGAPGEMATEMGPLCTARQRARIEDLVARSVAAGAKVVTGGTVPDGPGFYFPPTILDCSAAPEAPCLRDEFFGPVLSVQSFEDEAEALALANGTEYGLASGVFTRDLTRAHRMVRGIRAGIVWVNTYRAVSPIAPFGGHGLSGHGREGGMAAALDYTTVKAVWLRVSDDPIPDPFVMR